MEMTTPAGETMTKENWITRSAKRLAASWAALRGCPVYAQLPPVDLLRLEPDDRFVLQTENNLTNEQCYQLNEHMNAWLAGDKRAVVLTGGLRLVVVRGFSPPLEKP
jgi:Mlc titration factor MtfA (ptsG expression regulator)